MNIRFLTLVAMTITTLSYSHIKYEKDYTVNTYDSARGCFGKNIDQGCFHKKKNGSKYVEEIFANNGLHYVDNWCKQQLPYTRKKLDSVRKKLESFELRSKSLLTVFFDDIDLMDYGDEIIQNKINNSRWFNLSIRIGVNRSSFSMGNPNFESRRNLDFGSKTNPRIGLEAEFVLPFNKNKWAVIAEPTYQYYKSNLIINSEDISGGMIQSALKYNSIELPIGIRHYLFLNHSTKLFVNASYHFADFDFDSLVDFKRSDGSNFNDPLAFRRETHWAVGTGIKVMNRYSLEIKYLGSPRAINALFWNSEYETLSFIFGFTL
ncbi:porin family protein [Flagellimonas sp. 2504JD1-5]